MPQWNPALKTVKMTLQLWTFLRWAFNAAVTFHCELAVFNPRLLLTSALLERNLHAFLRSRGIQTQTPPTSSLQHLSARTTSRALCRPPARIYNSVSLFFYFICTPDCQIMRAMHFLHNATVQTCCGINWRKPALTWQVGEFIYEVHLLPNKRRYKHAKMSDRWIIGNVEEVQNVS